MQFSNQIQQTNVVASSNSGAGTPTSASSSSGSPNYVPVIIAGIVGFIVFVIVVGMIMSRRATPTPAAMTLGAAAGGAGGADWVNPIYAAPARDVAFDNPVYDRLDNLV